ncbi:MAG: hypothetical protein GY833_12565 [Aestuariibacter sp.]|nr:hypothetical protein [Aestuariibacter sp.]
MTYPIYHGITLAANAAFENLVIENLNADPIAPDEGRIWYNGTDKVYRMSVTDSGGAQQTLTFQTGEEFAAFLVELASTEADASGAKKVGYDGAAGANGSFTVAAGTLDVALDALVQAIDAEKKATADLADTAAGKGANAIGYEGATGEKGFFTLAAGTLKSSLDAMVAQIDANAEASSVSSQSIQDELDATQAAAGLEASGAYAPNEASNFLKTADFTSAGETASLKAADTLLDAEVKKVGDALASYKTANDAAVAERVNKAGDTMTGNLNMGDNAVKSSYAPQEADDLTNKAYVDSVATGLDVKKSVRVGALDNIDIVTGGLLIVDDVQTVAGDRVLLMGQTNPAENGIYIAAEGAWERSEDANEDVEVTSGFFTFVEEGTVTENNGYVLITDGLVEVGVSELNFEQFSGAGQVIAGAGISKQGNELFLNFGAGIVETPEDEIGIDFGAGLFTTEDGMTASTTAASKLEVKIDGTTLVKTADGLRVADEVLNASSNLQSELDLTQAGVGVDTAGNYVPATGANYIAAETSIHGSTVKLDAELKAVADGLTAEVTARGDADTALQNELNTTQTGAGLEEDGTFVAVPEANYVNTATSLKDADMVLDTQLKVVADGLAQEISDRASEDTAIRAGAGLLVTGAMPDTSATTYLQDSASIFGAVVDLDAALNAGLVKAATDTSNVVSQLNANKFSYVSAGESLVHSIQHNLDAPIVDITVWIQREDGKFYNDLALVTEESNNEITVTLSAAANVKVSVDAIRQFTDPTA